jgi:deoxycytidine triphosphate deaminase
MEYQGIVITGTSGSGKSTVAKLLSERNDSFQIVKAVTTRNKRDDDLPASYTYVDNEKFETIEKTLIVVAKYRDCLYGIEQEAFQSVVNQKKTPILILSPSSKIKDQFKFLSFFIDAPDAQLEERLKAREKKQEDKETNIIDQRKKDRNLSKESTYTVTNSNLDKTVEVIKGLWDNRNSGGLLPKQIIQLMIECGMLLDKVDDYKNIQGASYDLTLGDEYYSRGRICTLTAKNPFIRIDPYDYAIVTSAENANLPRDIAAKFGLTVGLFCQGVILSNGPQVDPGFKGKLFCLLFNTSNSPVVLKRREHHATIEFNKLLEPAPPYSGKYQGKDEIIYYLPSNTLKGAINELKEELEAVKSESRKVNANALGVISVFLAILGVLLTLR